MASSKTTLTSQPFGTMPDGRPVTLFTFAGETGVRVSITDYAGAIVSVWAPDRDGAFANVVLGYETLAQYLTGRSHFGALIGRFANRIASARFSLDGNEYTLPANDGPNHLHGGPFGFGSRLWKSKITGDALRLSLTSPDGDAGYPGTLHVEATYTLEGGDTLRLDYRATTDRATPVNFTNHVYFNLAGHDTGPITDHELTIFADRYTPAGPGLIPTGDLAPVEGTPLDFRKPHRIGDRIDADFLQLRLAGGYDQNFVLSTAPAAAPILAARLADPRSGRTMEVRTTEPALQFYSGNFLKGLDVGPGGAVYRHRHGLCLETQHFPDSPNQPAFPNCILRPGEAFTSTTLYRFLAR